MTDLDKERFDRQALKACHDYIVPPEADLDLVTRLAEVCLALHDWKTVRGLGDRMEKPPYSKRLIVEGWRPEPFSADNLTIGLLDHRAL